MPLYRVEKTVSGNDVIVKTNENGSETWIPSDPANSDYQRYLRYLDGEEENALL